ncbi:unnamed protein product, partial [Closterium sp. NIES-53]
MIEHVEEMLEMLFKCSKMGDVKYYLGMHVERDLDKGVLRLHQRKYCEGLAEKYGLQDGGKPATPLPSGFTVEPCADEEVVGERDRKLFHSMLFLQCDSRDGVSLFDHTSGASIAPPVTADSTVRSQWTNRVAIAHLAVRSHLPPAERAHFGQYKTAQSLYDAVVACYSSPATAALSRLMLPYLFPDLGAFTTVADLVAHSSTVLPCLAAPSGLLSGLHLPSFSTNFVSGADLQDAWVDQFTPGGQRVTHCTCSRTGGHLATFPRRPGSSLYTLNTAPPP